VSLFLAVVLHLSRNCSQERKGGSELLRAYLYSSFATLKAVTTSHGTKRRLCPQVLCDVLRSTSHLPRCRTTSKMKGPKRSAFTLTRCVLLYHVVPEIMKSSGTKRKCKTFDVFHITIYKEEWGRHCNQRIEYVTVLTDSHQVVCSLRR
jgi:hypothetical protein